MSSPFSRRFQHFMSTGEVPAEDAMPKGGLEAHDARFHGGHYDGKGKCEYREALAKGDKADKLAKAERKEMEKAAGGDDAASQQDYADLEDIRKKVEAAARLLNGRAGNLQALQASRRWPLLDSISGDPQIAADLAKLVKSSDPAIAGQAKDLEQILFDIAAQKKLGWKQGVGMVPAALQAPSAANASALTAKDYADINEIRDNLESAARLLNGRTGNLAALQASRRWPLLQSIAGDKQMDADLQRLAALGDPAMTKAANDLAAVKAAIDKSAQNNWNDPAGMVPSATDVPQDPNAPQGGMGGLMQALMGMLGGGKGGHGGGSPKGPAKKGPLSGQTLTPFMAPSPWAAQIQAMNANHPALNNPNWYKDEADKLTLQQAISQMESNGDIVKGGFRDSLDPNDSDDQELWGGWKPSKKLSDDTAKMAAVVFADLKKRFPGLKANWKNNMELRCGTKALTGGESKHTQDWRRHTILWNCEYGNIWPGVGLGKSNYGHASNMFFRDVLAHELGHALMSDMLPNGKRKMSLFHQVLNDNWGDDAKELWDWGRKYLSSYAVTDKGNGPSAAEFLAESVSLLSSPDYAPGFAPAPIEDFVFGTIFGIKKPTTP